LVFGQAVCLSDTPPRAERAAPAFGQHTRDVLRDVAGLDDATIERLIDDGVAHVMQHPEVVLERPYVHWLRKIQRLEPWGTPTFDPATEMMRRIEQREQRSG
jgi:hypothetical protein